jgi:moderate conductance mechanosensitive channel
MANRSRDFSNYVMILPVAYGEDIDGVSDVVREVAAAVQADDRYKPFILAPVEILGIDSFDPTAMRLKVKIKCAPQKQGEVGREFRWRLVHALKNRGVAMWSPQRTVTISAKS